MNEFLTVHRTDPRFGKLLMGFSSGNRVPIPVSSRNLDFTSGQMTFQMVSEAELQSPPLWKMAFKLVRWNMLPLTLSPALVSIAYSWANGGDIVFASILVLSMFFLHVGIFCLNDFFDHVGGFDRWNEMGGSRVIQRGWLRAWQVRRLGALFLVGALLFASPGIFVRPELLIFAAATLGLLGLGYWLSRGAEARPVLGLFVLFVVFGPFNSFATYWFLSGAWNVEPLVYGVLLGQLTVAYVFNRQIVSLVGDQNAGVKTLPILLGIDRSRILLLLGCPAVALALVGHLAKQNPLVGAFGAMALAPSIWGLYKNLKSAQSPVSSSMKRNLNTILGLYWASLLVILISIIWNMGV